MKNINLIYWNGNNLGDYLSYFVINSLSGKRIRRKGFYLLGIKGQLSLLLDFICGKVGKNKVAETLFFFEKNIIGIGSIISYGNKRSLIWGSGFMSNDETFSNGKILAVRGKLTNKKIVDSGNKGCDVFGDPALLLPLIVKPCQEKKYDLAIIPHWREYDFFYNKYSNKYKVIDIRTKNVELFISELTSCKCILSSSLHGIILSHAYNIPALWIKHGYIDTDGFKFYDYFSSVEIPFYEGMTNFDLYLQDGNWSQLFDDNNLYSLPNVDLRLIQKGLLNVAPFKIIDKYRFLKL